MTKEGEEAYKDRLEAFTAESLQDLMNYYLDMVRLIREVLKERDTTNHPKGCQCEAHQDYSWLK